MRESRSGQSHEEKIQGGIMMLKLEQLQNIRRQYDELQQRLQEAWHGVQALPADATLDAQVAAAHKLISAMVLAFRAPAA